MAWRGYPQNASSQPPSNTIHQQEIGDPNMQSLPNGNIESQSVPCNDPISEAQPQNFNQNHL